MRSGTLCRAAALALASAAAAAACSPPRSVSYFKSHSAELSHTIDRCIGSSGFDGQDCRNARQAYYELNGIGAHDGEVDGQSVTQPTNSAQY